VDNILAKDANDADVTLATKEIAGAHYDKVMLADPTSGAPFKAADDATLAALNIIAAAVQSAVEAINGKTPAAGALTDAQLRASAINVEPPPAVLTSYTQAGVIAINTVLMTLDCAQRRSVSIQCVAMGTTGVVTPEWSNDNATWLTATMFTAAGASATTFNAAGLWRLPVMARYLRLRLSTATTAGTTTLSVHRFESELSPWLATQPVSGTVTANVAGTGITGGTISPLTVAGASAEASSAKTTSGNSAAGLTNASGRNAHFIVNVSAASGTTPTLVVRVQVQDPVSSTWVDLPGAATSTITGTGATLLSVTNLPRTYRLAWVITGTTPSFTFSVGILPVI
jgi:hypothetical protein